MTSEQKKPRSKTPEEMKAERDLMMARAAIKVALLTFSKSDKAKVPPELDEYWQSLDADRWMDHLKLFAKELKKSKKVAVKKILYDLEHYIKDCRKLVPGFRRSKEEILLMMAIGQIKVDEFVDNLSGLPSNKEKLDRRILKQIKELDWQDDQALAQLDALTKELGQERVKKEDITRIENEIQVIEQKISERKSKRDGLAIKLVEWKARGTIDIAGADGEFRLDA